MGDPRKWPRSNAHRFGPTNAPWAYWGAWRDPWPRNDSDFADDFEKTLWALLDPARLPDILAHFNPLRYQKFSERVLEVIRRFEAGQLAAAEALKEFEEIAKDLEAEDRAHEKSGLNVRAYGVLMILETLSRDGNADGAGGERVEIVRGGEESSADPNRLARLAEQIDAIYGSDQSAPVGWHLKDQLRRELRQEVRYKAHQAELSDVREVASRVEDYALRHYVKVV